MDPALIRERFARLHDPRGADHAAEIGARARSLGQVVVVISACLCGEPVRWDGEDRRSGSVLERAAGAQVLPLCPELLGGLGCPRPRVALGSPDGGAVLDGAAGARDEHDQDATAALVRGAARATELALLCGATRAILKQGSPSCGTRETHVLASEPTVGFSERVAGVGVAAAALRRAGLSLEDDGA